MNTEAYQRVFRKLNEIRNENLDVRYAYILRPTDEPSLFQFIADADSSATLPFVWSPGNPLGEFTDKDENVAPGVYYVDTGKIFFSKAMSIPSFSNGYDKWGRFITGAAPILNNQAGIEGILGLDIDL